MNEFLSALAISQTGTWPETLQANLSEAIEVHIGKENFKLWLNNKPITLHSGGREQLHIGSYYGLTSGSRITFYGNQNTNPVINILHEFGHLVDNLWGDFFTKSLEREVFHRNERFFAGWNGMKYLGLRGDVIRKEALKESRIAGGDAWQQRGGTPHWEDWGDIFSNAMLGNINPENEIGQQILAFVARMEAYVKVKVKKASVLNTFSPNNKYRVTAEPSLRVREGPAISFTEIGNILFNEVVEKIGGNENGGWIKIRNKSGTLTGWCSAEYLQIHNELDIEEDDSHPDSRPNPTLDTTTQPANGVTRIVGERHGTKFYLTLCNPADIIIKVIHEDSRPSVIAKREVAKFGFNGDDWERNTRKVKGMEMSNGKLHQKRTRGEPSLIITQDGKAFISHKKIQGEWNVTSGLRYIVEKSKNLIPRSGTELKYTERHARSLRGLHADGRVMFLTVDGQFVHKGFTLRESAELMLEFGCAVAFDGGGGGDTVDVVDGVIANIPDDEGPGGIPSERKVPQTILVFMKESN